MLLLSHRSVQDIRFGAELGIALNESISIVPLLVAVTRLSPINLEPVGTLLVDIPTGFMCPSTLNKGLTRAMWF